MLLDVPWVTIAPGGNCYLTGFLHGLCGKSKAKDQEFYNVVKMLPRPGFWTITKNVSCTVNHVPATPHAGDLLGAPVLLTEPTPSGLGLYLRDN